MRNAHPSGRHKLQVFVLIGMLALLFAAPASTSLADAQTRQASVGTYTNPVIPTTAADPSIIKALDGYYYAVATSDSWPGGQFHLLPTWRSRDLVNWEFVGDAFPSKPAWVTGSMWAPDIRYFNHKYYMYYTASNTQAGGSAIGVATADSMTGPWTDSGGPIVPPRTLKGTNRKFNTIDPAEFTDKDGQKYLYYGGFFGGTLVRKLTPDGLYTAGPAYQIGHWDRYEGTYVIRHDVDGKAYYYNFSSATNCCKGPNTAYSVEVSRATSPMGPFIDQNGYPMLLNSPVLADSPDNLADDNLGAQGGGYPTLKDNGNKWHGVGHNAIITDVSGQDWILYHGIDRDEGWVPGLNPNFFISFRQGLIDKLSWTPDGWPVVNGGKGPSDTPTEAPVTTPVVGDNFNAAEGCAAPGSGDPLSASWQTVSGDWRIDPGDCVTGGYAEQTSSTDRGLIVTKQSAPINSRTECDLRLESGADGRYGCVVSYQTFSDSNGLKHNRYIAAFVDPLSNALVTVPYNNGHPVGQEQATALPAGFDPTDWQHLVVTEDSSQAGRPSYRFVLSNRDRDPLAVQERSFSADYGRGGSVGFITENAQAAFDNVTAATSADTTVPAPQTPPVGNLLSAYSDEFNGDLGPQWSWVREDPSRHNFTNGKLAITLNGDLYRNANNATNLLLEDQPSGNYVIETKITFDPNLNFQQAGLLIYSDDDNYIKVGPHHHFSLNKILSGLETLESQPDSNTPGEPPCDVQPSSTSNVAVQTYTHELCPHEGEAWDYLSNPNPTLNGSTAYDPQVTIWLRVYRNGDVYTPYTSLDGDSWVKGTAWTLKPASPDFPIKIGLFAFWGGSHNDVQAQFDYVRVYSQP